MVVSIDPFNPANLEANAGLAATLWHQFCELTKYHEGNPPLDWWGFKWAAYAMAGLEALPKEARAVSAPRCPSEQEIIEWLNDNYEYQPFRALLLPFLQRFAAQFFQPVSQPSPVRTGAGTPYCRKCGGLKEESRPDSNRCRACDHPAQPSPEGGSK